MSLPARGRPRGWRSLPAGLAVAVALAAGALPARAQVEPVMAPEAAAVGADPGFPVDQDPFAARGPREIHGQVGVEEGPLVKIER